MLILARLIEVYCIKEIFFEGSLGINANEEKTQTLIRNYAKVQLLEHSFSFQTN